MKKKVWFVLGFGTCAWCLIALLKGFLLKFRKFLNRMVNVGVF